MNIKAIKSTGLSFALAAAFLVTAGAAGSSNAFAQDWRWRDRDRDDWQDNRRERFEERRGFRDGLIEGREDAYQGRRFNPFGCERFRFGSSDYRQGFRMGSARAYRRGAYRDGYRNDQYRQRDYDDRWSNSRRY
jgi:Ni/Co efflux regulator RcnB